MAAIDPDLDELLSVLLTTPLAFCAQAAIDSIVDEAGDDPEERFFRRDFEPFHFERRSRYSQLDLADRVISGRIKREIRMLQDLRQMAPDLGLDSVGILPADPTRSAEGQGVTELLDLARETAMRAFLDAWNAVSGELRQRWETPNAG